MKRRDFFKWMGVASGAALSACKVNNADKKLLPYLVPPEEGVIPGVPRFIYTTCMECPAHCGLKVKILDDKPVKLEGHPDHPVNRGALCMRGQASLARLYHPDRFLSPVLQGGDQGTSLLSRKEAFERIKKELEDSHNRGLENIYFCSHMGGTLEELLDESCRELGVTKVAAGDVYNHGALYWANKSIYGRGVIPRLRIDKADFLLTFGADIFETFLSPVEWARQYGEARDKNDLDWVHLEPYLSQTGAAARERMGIKPGSDAYLLAYLLRNVPARATDSTDIPSGVPEYSLEETAQATGLVPEKIEDIAGKLTAARHPLAICGGPAATGANDRVTAQYTALLQKALSMPGDTLDFDRAFTGNTGGRQDFWSLVEGLEQGRVGVVFFARPHLLNAVPGLLGHFKKTRFKVALAEVPSPVTDMCDLVLPLSDPLESWGDAEPGKGIKGLLQPVLKPRKECMTEGDILLALAGKEETYQQYLARREDMGESFIDRGFKILHTPSSPLPEAPKMQLLRPGPVYRGDCLYIVPSLRSFDGRGKEIALLQEIPEPMSALTYGEALALSKEDAKKMGLRTGRVLEVTAEGNKIRLPVWISPGLVPGVFTLPIDSLSGLKPSVDKESGEFSLCLEGVKLSGTGEKTHLPILAGAYRTGKRAILPAREQEGQDKHHGPHHEYKRYSLLPEHEHKDYRWGLVIDLDKCSGCSACVAACYVENNIPLVGKEEHLRGREMAWLRIEPYYNDPGHPEFLPMMCQQCDYAPCETVCPVYATYHNPEGLNAQVYNRCVGTRYCANNCPYKARRFNWFDHKDSLPLYSASNPDLSVRPKGVMEKCTFCIQRIRFAKDRARDENRLVKDGEVIPACAQTCPFGAISFGNLMDLGSRVSKLVQSIRAYRVQELLGTEPAVYYLQSGKKEKG